MKRAIIYILITINNLLAISINSTALLNGPAYGTNYILNYVKLFAFVIIVNVFFSAITTLLGYKFKIPLSQQRQRLRYIFTLQFGFLMLIFFALFVYKYTI